MNAARRRIVRASWAALATCLLIARLAQYPAAAGDKSDRHDGDGGRRAAATATVPAADDAASAATSPDATGPDATKPDATEPDAAAPEPTASEDTTSPSRKRGAKAKSTPDSAQAETDPAPAEAAPTTPSDPPQEDAAVATTPSPETSGAQTTADPSANPPAPTDPADAGVQVTPPADDGAHASPAANDPAAPTSVPAETPPAAEAPSEPSQTPAAPPESAAPVTTPTPTEASGAGGSSPKIIGTVWIVGTFGADCHAQMDIDSPVLAAFPEGTKVDVIGRTIGDWQPVLCNGSPGYLRASSITWWAPTQTDAATPSDADNGDNRADAADEASPAASDGDPADGQTIANFALQYIGYPYINAAEGPNAFDCSGLTMFVIQHTLGVNITHDMFVQYDMGTKIDRADLEPGDLVFFQNTFKPGLSHVGIYIGKGQFVNAENPQTGVVISDLDSDYYASRWYGAVRYR